MNGLGFVLGIRFQQTYSAQKELIEDLETGVWKSKYEINPSHDRGCLLPTQIPVRQNK